MSSHPAISVVMPVYNGQAFLRKAVDSILNQSFTDFEFIIVDDCSTDNSRDIIAKYQDARIKLIRNEVNQGIADTLNRGIKQATGKYIARMDADDISMPERFQLQYDFLERNPDIGVCGGAIKTFGGWLNRTCRFPSDHDAIICAMLVMCPFAHPTIMMRSELFENNKVNYRGAYRAEDFDLYRQLLDHTKSANLNEILLRYRTHKKQLTNIFASEISKENVDIKKDIVSKLNFDIDENAIEVLSTLTERSSKCSVDDLDHVRQILVKLQNKNDKTKRFDPVQFNLFIAQCWLRACKSSSFLGMKAFIIYFRYRKQFVKLNELSQKAHMMLLCVMRA